MAKQTVFPTTWTYPPKTSVHSVKRDAEEIVCPKCGAVATRVPVTAEEDERFGCGGATHRFGCCSRAFVCKKCDVRIVGNAFAPSSD